MCKHVHGVFFETHTLTPTHQYYQITIDTATTADADALVLHDDELDVVVELFSIVHQRIWTMYGQIWILLSTIRRQIK